jgi:hypothetical protein
MARQRLDHSLSQDGSEIAVCELLLGRIGLCLRHDTIVSNRIAHDGGEPPFYLGIAVLTREQAVDFLNDLGYPRPLMRLSAPRTWRKKS